MRTSLFIACFILVLSGTIQAPQINIAVPENNVDRIESSLSYDDTIKASTITSEALMEARASLLRTYDMPVTQKELANHLDSIMRAIGADPELAFPTLVMSGPELVEPHGNMTDDYTHYIDPNVEDVVMIDIGCRVNGYCTDITRTFFFEDVSEEIKNAYNDVLLAHDAVISQIRAGASIMDLDAIVRYYLNEYIDDTNYYFHPYWGHGVGRFVHESPFLWGGNNEELYTGAVLAIEPGIYCSDGWAVRIEDVVLVTETGVEYLSHLTTDIEDITIKATEPRLNYSINYENYEYDNEVDISADFSGNFETNIQAVAYHDGYSWQSMEIMENQTYSYRYDLNTSYSSSLWTIVRCNTTNSVFYFTNYCVANIEADSEISLNEAITVNNSASTIISRTLNHTGAVLIRFRMKSYDAPDWDQMLVIDSKGAVLEDYRNRTGEFWWTPWSSGEQITLLLHSTSSVSLGGMGDFFFEIDKYQIVEASSNTSGSITTTNSSDDILQNLGVAAIIVFAGTGIVVLLVVVILWMKKK